MCNRYGLKHPAHQLGEEFNENGLPVVWPDCDDGDVESFTIVTATPGPDAAEVHNRQPVILGRSGRAACLDLSKDVQPLLRPSSKGVLEAREFSRIGP